MIIPSIFSSLHCHDQQCLLSSSSSPTGYCLGAQAFPSPTPTPPSSHSNCLIPTHHHQPRNHSPLKGRKRIKERRKWKGSKPPPARGCRHQYYSINTSNRREDRGFSLLFDGQSRIREGLQPSRLSCLSLGRTCSLQLQRAAGKNRPTYFHQLWGPFMYVKKGDQKE